MSLGSYNRLREEALGSVGATHFVFMHYSEGTVEHYRFSLRWQSPAASVVHDYFVGEGGNPDVPIEACREADKMFYHACRAHGCSRRFAAILRIGVSIGTRAGGFRSLFNAFADPNDESLEECPVDVMLRKMFERLAAKLDDRLEDMTVDELQAALDGEL
jgi:hypothetical protein